MPLGVVIVLVAVVEAVSIGVGDVVVSEVFGKFEYLTISHVLP